MRERGFEVVSAYINNNISLPKRKTAASAGYDIESAEEIILEPGKVTLVPTGLKAYMQADEYLGLHVRSGFSIKNVISCINSQGIIDADYYNNPDNEGHIMVRVHNGGSKPVTIVKGDRFCQGIFVPFGTADEEEVTAARHGGFGSTDR